MAGYYLRLSDANAGPFTEDELRKMKVEGHIADDTWAWREGDANWRPCGEYLRPAGGPPPLPAQAVPGAPAATPPPFWQRLSDKVGDVAGLEKLEGFSIRHLFSEVFKKHSPEEIEEHFVVGTPSTTPPLSAVSTEWPAPWAFVRTLVATVLVTLVFHAMLREFKNPKIIPAWIFTGSVALPFATLVFFFEVNLLKNIPFFRLLRLVLIGGVLSLLASLILFSVTDLSSWLGAMAAGPIEETGKLAAALICVRGWKGNGWTLNGLLIGAGVGMGFSAFETAGYIFESLVVYPRGPEPETTMLLRMLTSPFSHVIWTAMTVGALWKVKAHRPFRWEMLVDPRFLRIFGIAVALHVLWNSPLRVPLTGPLLGFLAKFLILGLIGWIVVLMLIQGGLREVAKRKAEEAAGQGSTPVK